MVIVCHRPGPAQRLCYEQAPWWRSLGRHARRPWGWLWRLLAARRARLLLDALDDRTLKDIGLTRMDLRYLYRNGNGRRT